MSDTDTLTLHLTAGGIDAYCQQLARLAATTEKRLAALDALATFIATQADAGSPARVGFRRIRQVLSEHIEQARAALLHERGAELHRALAGRRLAAIAAIHRALSRAAFWTLLARIEPGSNRPSSRRCATGRARGGTGRARPVPARMPSTSGRPAWMSGSSWR